MLVLYIVLGIIALVLLVAALIPATGVIRRSIVINRSPEEVFAYVADYQNYLSWNPWSKMDPQATNTISSPSTGVGASWAWDGKKVGQGKLTTEALEPGRAIRSRLEFFKPFKGLATDSWSFEPNGTGTRVTWGYEGKQAWPVNRLFWVLMVKKMLTQQFDQGLTEIKTQLNG